MFELNRIQQIFLVVLIVILLILSGIGYYKYFKKPTIVITPSTENTFQYIPRPENPFREKISPEKIVVYICGQVKEPGLYKVRLNCRVAEALKLAGGVTNLADLNYVNLAQKLYDEDMVYVPVKGEKKKYSKLKKKKRKTKKKFSNRKSEKKNITSESKTPLEEELLESHGIIQTK